MSNDDKWKRQDGWYSLLTGLGTSLDKTQATRFTSEIISTGTASELWEGDDIAARIIETLPTEELRQGYELNISDDSLLKEKLTSLATGLNLNSCIQRARCYERAYGGGGIIMGIDDGQADLSQPLNLLRVREIKWLLPVEPDELMPLTWYDNPFIHGNKYGQVSTYSFRPILGGPQSSCILHESRIIIFPGIRVSNKRTSRGWGSSVLVRVIKVLKDFNTSWGSAGILVTDFSQAIFKMKGLAELIAMDKDSVVFNRLKAVELSRSTARAILIDSEEEFKREQTPVSGLPELLDRFSTRLAAAADMPLTLLMGQSPGGLNATGESDIRFFYDRVKASEVKNVLPGLTQFFTVLMATLRVRPKSWGIEFKPLFQPSEAEAAAARKTQADTDAIYIDRGVLTADEVAINRFGGDDYSFQTSINLNARLLPKVEEVAEEVAEEEEVSEKLDRRG